MKQKEFMLVIKKASKIKEVERIVVSLNAEIFIKEENNRQALETKIKKIMGDIPYKLLLIKRNWRIK